MENNLAEREKKMYTEGILKECNLETHQICQGIQQLYIREPLSIHEWRICGMKITHGCVAKSLQYA